MRRGYKVLEHNVADELINKWQNVVNTLACIFKVPAGLIMRVHEKVIEVFVSSQTVDNPYKVGASEYLHGKLYCETVIQENRLLYIDDALKYKKWKHNPDIPLNMTSYLGIPIHWPSGEIFGTICVLDSKPVKPTDNPKAYEDLLWSFGMIIEDQLKLMFEIDERKRMERALERSNITLSQQVKERTWELEDTNRQVSHLNAVLWAIRNVNQLITVEKNRDELIKGVCDNLIESRGYKNAWIVLVDVSGKLVRAVQAGLGKDFHSMMAKLRAGEALNCVARALNQPDVLIIDNPPTVCDNCPIRDKYDNLVRMAVRLEYEGKLMGMLSVAIPRHVARDRSEQSLFMEVAGDISYALHNIEMEEERKQAEREREGLQKQLLQSQKMEAIGTLAGGIAHDFNNLLTVIKGYTELSFIKLKESSPLHSNLKEIREAADHAANLTRQLLLYSRRQPMNFEQLNINDTVKGLLKMLGRLIGEDVKIHTDFQSDIWNIKADPGNIEQIIMNLAVNARDAMPAGGTLTFKTEKVWIDECYCEAYTYAHPGKFVCLEIVDNGAGMDQETMDRIFEPFFTTKGAGKGTGLGMSVVYGIVRGHDGWINVCSELGEGTTFKIYLPASLEEKDPGKSGVETVKNLQGRGERILIVEDEESVLIATKRLLKECGYEIVDAHNAEAALEIFKEFDGHFDLLFTDMVLPDMNGLQLIDELHTEKPDLKALLSSGYAGDRIHREAIQEKQYPFIQKPYELTELLRTIKEAIYRKR